ncbi:hypothetical protein N802_19140 [Knoellia sinensis KCTC 19936]|uniref:Uncharacterized protein n=1 Tax=Knoellia sinensis KCTC 19936 TaxID=1385520 RepID=A0A0A0J7C5_9MICO|nr:hypothetical protein [Knoellia sinensis]KGN31957.1 hypothetical protein N802_19140 [Knoellia sinensis KCTC 19936]
MTGEWWPAILAFVGAAVGSGASFYAARRDTQAEAETAAKDLTQRERASAREEWGRRFTAALADLNSDDSFRRRHFGRIVLGAMVNSDLTSPEDRRLLEDILLAHARFDQEGDEVGLGSEGMLVDDVRVVEDDGDEAGRGAAHE